MNGALLVPQRRRAMVIQALGIRCDGEEIPEPSDGGKPVGWWLAGICGYTGLVSAEADQEAEPREISLKGTAALAVTADRVLGIMSGEDVGAPALWWSWDLSAIEVQTDGVQGLFKKRPKTVALEDPEDNAFDLAMVSRLYRNSGSHQAGQEGSLVEALKQ